MRRDAGRGPRQGGRGRKRVRGPSRRATFAGTRWMFTPTIRSPVMPATTQQTSVLERFLRYVKLDTTSDPTSTSVPSTAKQLVLLDLLVEELKALGVKDAARDDQAIVMGT